MSTPTWVWPVRAAPHVSVKCDGPSTGHTSPPPECGAGAGGAVVGGSVAGGAVVGGTVVGGAVVGGGGGGAVVGVGGRSPPRGKSTGVATAGRVERTRVAAVRSTDRGWPPDLPSARPAVASRMVRDPATSVVNRRYRRMGRGP